MQDTQILSAFHEPPSGEPANPAPTLVFDACHVGVVLRTVLFVETVVAVAAMFGSATLLDWLLRASVITSGALPACLLWLVVACSLKLLLARLDAWAQYACGMLLGAAAGAYAGGALAWMGLLDKSYWLASASAGALMAALLVTALVLRVRGVMPAAAKARLAELQSRIRPHFLFNTLNSAIALVRAEPAKAEALLEDLSELFRYALKDQGDSVTLAEEISLARAYLAIEQVRFGERLQLEWALDDSANLARLPPLLLQPLVENAVHHGVEPSASGATVRISTRRQGGMVTIKVTNSVPAGPGAPGHGVALANVRDRLRLLHDVQGQFQSGFQNGVFQVRIEVPA